MSTWKVAKHHIFLMGGFMLDLNSLVKKIIANETHLPFNTYFFKKYYYDLVPSDQ